MTVICNYCGIDNDFQHDHQPDGSGLDDGPEINVPRKKPNLDPVVVAEARKRAWETRRNKYGRFGHK